MEKYSKWTDSGTGLNPFVPIRGSVKPLVGRIVDGVVGAVLTALRLPLFVASFLLLGAAESVLLVLDAVSLGALWRQCAIRPIVWCLLFSCGIVASSESVLDRTQRKTARSKAISKPAKGDLIVAVNRGAIDMLLLAVHYSPSRYVFPAWRNGDHTGSGSLTYCLFSSLFALLVTECIRGGLWKEKISNGTALAPGDILRSSGPVVLFAEATRTTGKGILTFPKDVAALMKAFTTSRKSWNANPIHVVGVRCTQRNNTTSQGMQSLPAFVFRMMRVLMNAPLVLRLSEHEFPIRFSGTGEITDDEVLECIPEYLAKCCSTRTTNLTCADKISFEQYWESTQKPYARNGGKKAS